MLLRLLGGRFLDLQARLDSAVDAAAGVSQRQDSEPIQHLLEVRLLANDLLDLCFSELATELGHDLVEHAFDALAFEVVVDGRCQESSHVAGHGHEVLHGRPQARQVPAELRRLRLTDQVEFIAGLGTKRLRDSEVVPQRLDQFSNGIAAAGILGISDLVLGNLDQLPSRLLLVYSIDRCEQGVAHLAELHPRLIERINCQLEASALHFRGPGPAAGHSVLVCATLGGHGLARLAVDHTEVAAGRTLGQGGHIGDNLWRRLSCCSLSAVPGVLQCRAELQAQAGRPLRCALDASTDRDGGESGKSFENTARRLLGSRAFGDAGLGSDGLNELGDGVGRFGGGVTEIHLGLRLLLGGLSFRSGAGGGLGLLLASFEVHAFFADQGERLGLCAGD